MGKTEFILSWIWLTIEVTLIMFVVGLLGHAMLPTYNLFAGSWILLSMCCYMYMLNGFKQDWNSGLIK